MLSLKYNSALLENLEENITSPLSIHSASVSSGLNRTHLFVKRISRANLLTGITYSSLNQPADQINLKFQLTEAHETYFTMVMGYIGLGNHHQIVADPAQKTFSMTISMDQIQEVREYFRNLLAWFKSEINFRNRLSQVIALNKEYNAKYSSLLDDGNLSEGHSFYFN